jgi:Holliday junction resolvase RusA-like endonuclease
MKRVMELTVWDRPEPQRRARFSRKTGRAHDHPKNVGYRARIHQAYQDEFWPAGEPVPVMFERGVVLAASLIAHVPCPASISIRARVQGRAGWPQGRDGDLDNIEKAVWDALQDFAYWNDKQIVMHRPPYYITYAFDQRTGADLPPHLYIRLEEL